MLLLTGLSLTTGYFFDSADLQASGRNGQIIRTSGPNAQHVCQLPEANTTPAPEQSNAPKHRSTGNPALQRLTKETREALLQISSEHRKLMQASATLSVERHLFVINDVAYAPGKRSDFVGDRTVVAIRYDNAETPESLRCVILDHTQRNHDDPARWIRRIARINLSEQNEVAIHFETLAHNAHSTVQLNELETRTQLRISRKLLRQLRDVQYVIDRTLPALTARSQILPF